MLWCHVSPTAMTFEIGYGEGGEEAPVSLEAEERKYERQWLCGFLAVAGEGRGAVYGKRASRKEDPWSPRSSRHDLWLENPGEIKGKKNSAI